MKLSIQAGSTSQTINVFVRDSSSTTGGGLTGLVFNSGSLTAYYALPKAAAVSITLVTLAAVTSAYSSGGFKEIDATNMPGWYRLDIPDAAIASGRFTSIHLKGATNMAPLPIEIELTGWNNQDAAAGGLSRIDATISSRSTYAGADTAGTTTLLGRIPGTVQPQTGDAYARLGAPAGASVSVDVAAVKTDTGGLRTDYTTARAGYLDTLNGLVAAIWASVTRTLTDKTGFTLSAAYDAAKTAGDATAASQTTILAAIPSAGTIADTTLARAMPAETYAANGSVPTLGQMLYMLWSGVANFSVSGTTLTTLKLDRATTAMTFGLDDATNPTRRTRST